MRPKHTAGPWRWRPVDFSGATRWDQLILENHDRRVICEVVPGSFRNGQHDARLLVEAPAMMELVRRLADPAGPCETDGYAARELLKRIIAE